MLEDLEKSKSSSKPNADQEIGINLDRSTDSWHACKSCARNPLMVETQRLSKHLQIQASPKNFQFQFLLELGWQFERICTFAGISVLLLPHMASCTGPESMMLLSLPTSKAAESCA